MPHRKVNCRCIGTRRVFESFDLGNFIHDPRITSKNEEITLDFPMMTRSMKLLLICEDEISSTIANALGNLFKQISNELSSNRKGELEEDAHFLNIFFIIFQLPYLSDPTFLFEHARSFYSLFFKLSLDFQVKFIRILAKHKDDLNTYVSHVQQYITMYTMKWCDHTQINSLVETLLSHEPGRFHSICHSFIDEFSFVGMHEGLNVLRILFYANLLAGERDTSDIIETERDNEQKMDVELVNRRQRHNDDDDEENLAEQESSGVQRSDNRSEVARTSSQERHRSTSFNMRTSTSEQDEIESIYENSLQIRLHLEPNEYRHGHLSFDSFTNEFANEKIEISKEYLEFIRQRPATSHFSFIVYPFFLSTINKIGKNLSLSIHHIHFSSLSALLNIENKVQMYRQRHSSFVNSIFSGVRLDPFFKICVRRNYLIEDALIAVCYPRSFLPSQVFFL